MGNSKKNLPWFPLKGKGPPKLPQFLGPPKNPSLLKAKSFFGQEFF